MPTSQKPVEPSREDTQVSHKEGEFCETEARRQTSPSLPASGRPPDWPVEIGGPPGPEPTRFGDWEKNGRCIDF